MSKFKRNRNNLKVLSIFPWSRSFGKQETVGKLPHPSTQSPSPSPPPPCLLRLLTGIILFVLEVNFETMLNTFYSFFFLLIPRMALEGLALSMVIAYHCGASAFVVCDSCLVRGDVLQCQACAVNLRTDDSWSKCWVLLFLRRGLCWK